MHLKRRVREADSTIIDSIGATPKGLRRLALFLDWTGNTSANAKEIMPAYAGHNHSSLDLH